MNEVVGSGGRPPFKNEELVQRVCQAYHDRQQQQKRKQQQQT